MRLFTTWAAFLGLALLSPTVASAADDVQSLIAAADTDYAQRNEPGKLEDAERKLAEAEKLAPDSFDVLWRLAQVGFWKSDDPKLSDDEKSKIGKQAWAVAERAAARAPDRVEGHYFTAVCMGNYSLGIGILKALTQGIEGKFKRALSAAERIDPKYMDGGIFNAWGRFYYSLPWPKYDSGESERYLRKAVELNPANLRARVYLADLFEKEGNPKEAKKLLDAVLASKPGAYDLPEELRAQELARMRLPALEKSLK